MVERENEIVVEERKVVVESTLVSYSLILYDYPSLDPDHNLVRGLVFDHPRTFSHHIVHPDHVHHGLSDSHLRNV